MATVECGCAHRIALDTLTRERKTSQFANWGGNKNETFPPPPPPQLVP